MLFIIGFCKEFWMGIEHGTYFFVVLGYASMAMRFLSMRFQNLIMLSKRKVALTVQPSLLHVVKGDGYVFVDGIDVFCFVGILAFICFYRVGQPGKVHKILRKLFARCGLAVGF